MRRRDEARVLFILFFVSGATALIYETILVKLLGYVFGNTNYAVSTVLSAFMAGLALGAWFIGRFADRHAHGIGLYALLEAGIAAYCALIPLLFRSIEPLYLALHRARPLTFGELTLVRLLLSFFLMLPPAFLMGGTLPALTRWAALRGAEAGRRITTLYAANTLGAASGVFVATYFLLGAFGLHGTLFLAVVASLVVAVFALRLSRKVRLDEGASWSDPEAEAGSVSMRMGRGLDRLARALGFPGPSPAGGEDREPEASGPARSLLVVSFLTGAITFVFEVTWTHVLQVTVGTSVYAFGIMLTTLLLGLAVGGRLVSDGLRDEASVVPWLSLGLVLQGISVFALFPLWDEVPKLFGLSGLLRPSFWVTEALRFAGCLGVMLVPAILLGMAFPLVLRIGARTLRRLGSEVGTIYLFNSLGCIVGSLLAGFVLLPRMGSELTLRVTAAVSILLGLLVPRVVDHVPGRRSQLRLALLALGSIVIGLLVLPGWDKHSLTSGANVLGVARGADEALLFYHEDGVGGLTSVVASRGTRTLLTNGKFQGDDTGEMAAQKQFAIAPMLFVRSFDRALVIGLGTGVTAHTVASAPFSAVDVAEIAPGIVEAARRFFPHVNGRVLDDPRVTTHLADGRNFLLLSRNEYDLITIELSNIWFAGAANLYSRDFYSLCRSRLRPRGILQQWVQLHHIDTVDFISVLKTMRDVFPHMALFVGGGQGILIGSAEPLAIDYGLQARLRADPQFRQALLSSNLLAGEALSMLNDLYLFEDNLTMLVAMEKAARVSSDAYPFLEYSTPAGNQLPYALLANQKLIEIRRFRGLPPILGLPPDKAQYLQGLLAFGQARFQDAQSHLEASLRMGNAEPVCALLLAETRRRLVAVVPPKAASGADGLTR